ncbi:hypothetical protein AB4Y40_39045 [Paraburkholderia sp. EG287B]
MATVLVLLASAVLLVRRERHLFLIASIVKSMPTPVVVVAADTGKVLVAN